MDKSPKKRPRPSMVSSKSLYSTVRGRIRGNTVIYVDFRQNSKVWITDDEEIWAPATVERLDWMCGKVIVRREGCEDVDDTEIIRIPCHINDDEGFDELFDLIPLRNPARLDSCHDLVGLTYLNEPAGGCGDGWETIT